jgi:hypothetical protein
LSNAIKPLVASPPSCCLQARQELLQLLVQLRTGDSSRAACAAEEALQHLKALQQQHAQLLEQQAPHLQAAVMFKQPPVAAASKVSAFLPFCKWMWVQPRESV